MNQRVQNLCTGGMIAVVCLALAMGLGPGLVGGKDVLADTPTGKLIVHEWGTFTSFSGSDGVNLEFRPLDTVDVPGFVERAAISFAKRDVLAQQRMETPVTYFYTDVPREVTARVDFPQGQLTEWYPDARPADAKPTLEPLVGRQFLDWGSVRLIPPAEFARLQVRTLKGVRPAELPRVRGNDHYGAARATDSAIVETVDRAGISHFEKFLFYRGIGNFDLPVTFVAHGEDRFTVSNSGAEPTGAMLLLQISGGAVRFAQHGGARGQESVELRLPPAASSVTELADALAEELTKAGLYQKEALAMVNTWRASWFGEDGTRLLYLVPQRLTEQLLPLSIEPAPQECVRVLVGRLETITPEDCQRLSARVASAAADEAAMRAELKSLGRFAEPAIQFVLNQEGDAARRTQLETALATLRPRSRAVANPAK